MEKPINEAELRNLVEHLRRMCLQEIRFIEGLQDKPPSSLAQLMGELFERQKRARRQFVLQADKVLGYDSDKRKKRNQHRKR